MASATRFDIDVPDIGMFTFRHRTQRDLFKIEGETSRELGGPVDDPQLQSGANMLATLRVLLVVGPEGWNLDKLIDPFEPEEGVLKLQKIFGALREAEARFRNGTARDGE